MRAALRTAFSTPPAAHTCGPTFHGLHTRVGKPFAIEFASSGLVVRRRLVGLSWALRPTLTCALDLVDGCVERLRDRTVVDGVQRSEFVLRRCSCSRRPACLHHV